MATTSLANRKRLEFVRNRVTNAREWRRSQGFDRLWRDMILMYQGRKVPKVTYEMDLIVVNIAFSTINTIAPAVAVNAPKLTVNAMLPEHEDHAVVAEHVLNYWWRHYDFKRATKLATLDYLILGHGWKKTGWRYVEDLVFGGSDIEDELHQMKSDIQGFFAEQGDVEPENDFTTELSELRVVEDRPYVERVDPFSMYIDPEATSWEGVRWIAQEIVKDHDLVKNDKRYKPRFRRSVEADGRDPIGDERNDFDHDEVLRTRMFEYYDLQAGWMCTFSMSGDDFAVEPIEQPYKFGHPFVPLRNYEVPNQLYPMGELEAISDLQDELNKTRSQLMSHRRKFAEKIFYDPRGLNEDALALLHDPDSGTFVPINGSVPIDRIAQTQQLTNMASELYQMSSDIVQNVEYVSGVSGFLRGINNDNTRKTATEASILRDAGNARVADKLQTVEDCIARTGRNVLLLAQQYLEQDQAVRIVGNDGAPYWFYFDRNYIQGEFDLEVVAGSTQPHDETYKRQNSLQMLQQLQPYIGQVLDPVPVLTEFMKTFGIRNPEKFFIQAQPMPPGGGDPSQGGGMGPGGPGGPGGPPAPQQDLPQLTPPGVPDAMPPGFDPNAGGNAMTASAGMGQPSMQ